MQEAKARCTIREFRQWQAYWQVEPWEPDRADMRNALLCYMVAASVPSKKRRRLPPFHKLLVGEWFKKRRERQSVQEQHAVFRSFVEAHNRAVRRREPSPPASANS